MIHVVYGFKSIFYVENPFTTAAKFNFELFKEHAGLAQRIMDDIIDLELEKIDDILAKISSDPEDFELKRVERKLWENIRRKALEGRRTGIGITAEGDMLAGLGLKYGSENAIDFSTEVHKTLARYVYRSSVDLAAERGAFTLYDTQREKDNPFILRLKEADPELYEGMVKYGRRNIALLTVAPTGTTSLMTQTTSGIEPVFMPVYKRRKKVNPTDQGVNITFVDNNGDSWEEFMVLHHKFVNWLSVNGYNIEDVKQFDDKKIDELVQKSPYYGATANEIDWVQKVKMQGNIQKWVDHSISVTVNLPKDIPEAKVAEVYKTAWESGCKGITVYREGSREGVLINKNETKIVTNPPKRPKELDAEVIRFKNNNEDWITFVGLIDGRPYEVFTGRIEEGILPIPKSIVKGKIIKHRSKKGMSRYDFQYIDKYGYPNTVGGLSHMFDKEFWNYAKLISGVLRHGMPIPYVINLISSLHLDIDTINSWKNGVERALKKYIPNGTKAKAGVCCLECGSDTMVYQEGCLICSSCGSSKCG